VLSDSLKQQVERATVTITKKRGRGVLVPGNIILTAAHCVDYSCDGGMALGDFFLEEIQTNLGVFRLETWAVEPVADIAILGEPDNQQPAFQRDVEIFESFCEQTTPVRFALREFELFQPLAVYVYTHEGVWVEGSAKQCTPNAKSLFVEFDGPIKGGTSGSAIVDETGALVGLISIAGGAPGVIDVAPSGPAPRPHLALPVWAVQTITQP
jgi:Trypsin-like peptidase domain